MPTDVTAEHETKTIKEFIKDIAGLEPEPEPEKESEKDLNKNTNYRIPPNGSSGCDLVLDKIYKDSVVQTIYLFPSLNQYWFFDHKKNKKEVLDKKNLRSFLNLMEHTNDTLTIEHCVFDSFQRSAPWIDKFLKLIKQPMFIDMAKANVISVSNIFRICDRTSQTWYEVKNAKLWWNGDIFVKDEVDVNPSYLETAKQMIKEMTNLGYSHNDALAQLYGMTQYATDDIDHRFDQSIQFFTVLCDMYGPEFMKACISDFIKNPRISGLDTKALMELLTMNANTGNNQVHLYQDIYDSKPSYERYQKWITTKKNERNEVVQFSPNSLRNYLFVLSEQEGQIDTIEARLVLWRDTLSMDIQLHGKVTNKYPLNLATEHDKLAYLSRIYKQLIEEEKWKKVTDKAKTYEVSDSNWMLIAPKTPEDIKNEARQQGNCVASYIQRMIDGECIILFFRKRSDPNNSVCTVEIRGDELRQFLARFNCPADEVQCKGMKGLLDKLKKEKNIEIRPGMWLR